jgi:replicative DNA helicase
MSSYTDSTLIQSPERTLPHNEDAERNLLGALLLDNTTINDIYRYVTPDFFYSTNHTIIFKAIEELFNQNQSVDLITLTEELSRMGKLDAAGGAPYLTALIENVVTTANVLDYAQILKEKAIARRLILAAEQIALKSYDSSLKIDTVVEEAERMILDIAQQKQDSDVQPLEAIMNKVIDNIDLIFQRRGGLTGLPTGFKSLNNLTGGFQKSDLIILAARPSVGKTSFALNIATHVASPIGTYPGAPALVFSLEMSKEQIVQRMLCTDSGVSSKKIRDGTLSQKNLKELMDSADRLMKVKLYIDDTPGINIMELRAKALRLKSKCPELGLIIIDYLQLMSARSRSESRQQEISEISRSLKALAREINVPIVALSQLNRQVEMRGKDAKPQLSDLRESGAIEQDADVIMFLHRPLPPKGEEEVPDTNRPMTLIVAKQRNGPTGDIDLMFINAYTRFVEQSNNEAPSDYYSYGPEDENYEEQEGPNMDSGGGVPF